MTTTQTKTDEQIKSMSKSFKEVNDRLNSYLLKDRVSNYHFLLFDLFLE